MKSQQYWHLTIQHTPYMCKAYVEQVLTKQDPLAWCKQWEKNHIPVFGARMELLQYRKLTKEEYNVYRTIRA